MEDYSRIITKYSISPLGSTLFYLVSDPYSPFSMCSAARVNQNPVRFISLNNGEKGLIYHAW